MSIEYSRFAQIILAVCRFCKKLKKEIRGSSSSDLKYRHRTWLITHTQLPRQKEKAHRAMPGLLYLLTSKKII